MEVQIWETAMEMNDNRQPKQKDDSETKEDKEISYVNESKRKHQERRILEVAGE